MFGKQKQCILKIQNNKYKKNLKEHKIDLSN